MREGDLEALRVRSGDVDRQVLTRPVDSERQQRARLQRDWCHQEAVARERAHQADVETCGLRPRGSRPWWASEGNLARASGHVERVAPTRSNEALVDRCVAIRADQRQMLGIGVVQEGGVDGDLQIDAVGDAVDGLLTLLP